MARTRTADFASRDGGGGGVVGLGGGGGGGGAGPGPGSKRSRDDDGAEGGGKEGTGAGGSGPSGPRSPPRYKVLVLDEVDHLSREAQHALRRTMEKHAATCRLILICSSLGRVLEAVRSRCLCVRVPAPTAADVANVLCRVADAERLRLPDALAARIAVASGRNLRRATLALQTARVQRYPFDEDQEAPVPDWERYCDEVARGILREQTPRMLYETRGRLYELIVSCVPSEVILRRLALALIEGADSALAPGLAASAALFEARLGEGSKAIFHLEAFVARAMADLKRNNEEMLALAGA